MLRNYFTLAIRNLLKRKLYSFINIGGLATGVAVCLVILQYVDFELSYDNFHSKADQVFRIIRTTYNNGELRSTSPLTGYAQGPAMVADVPEVKTSVRTHPMYGGAVLTYQESGGEEKTFRESDLQYVDSTFFDVFTYDVSKGNPETALDDPNAIVITQKAADKYFGKNIDPVGKTLRMSGGWTPGDYTVSAVISKVPENAHLQFDFLLPTHNLLRNGQYKNDNGWGWYNFNTYVELHNETTAKAVEAKMPVFVEKYLGKELKETNRKEIVALQPVTNIHLSPGYENESSATMSVNTIYFFIVISIFIMAIAWVNYINLSTARAMERAREVGVKKSVGAFRSQLIGQFIFESVLVNFLGVFIAVFIALLLLPVLGDIVGKHLAFNFTDIRMWGILFALFAFGSLVSGAYPAFVLSSFKATTVLKGGTETKAGGFSLRKVLVVFQFASSLILIAGTFAIYRQLNFMQNQDKGMIMDQMLIVDGPSVGSEEGYTDRLISFKNEVKQYPSVLSVTSSGAIPGGGYNWGTSMRKLGAPVEESKGGSVTWVDTDFIDTYGITLLAGKVWNPDNATDMKGMLINEAAITAFGLGDAQKAVEEKLLLGDDTVTILGVLKNYHWNSLKTEHKPILLGGSKISGRCFSIHLQTENMNESIARIEKQYKEAFPGNPFDYYFLDDFFNNQYRDDQQFGKIFSLFAVLAIIIACLGLWGLASFTTNQKLREIGIRKVLGASVTNIITLLSRQFLILVLIASVIALPLTWYGISSWLGNFAFHISLGWELFVVPVVILIVIAIGTVILQIIRGANINPAKILRTE